MSVFVIELSGIAVVEATCAEEARRLLDDWAGRLSREAGDRRLLPPEVPGFALWPSADGGRAEGLQATAPPLLRTYPKWRTGRGAGTRAAAARR